MIAHPELVATAEQISVVAATLKKKSTIAFDTEFIRESTFFPMIEIIQVATEEESWLIDAQAFRNSVAKGGVRLNTEALRPLIEVFQDPSILKIVHAAQGDQECLFSSMGIVASPSLDTAAAASLCGYGDGIGLGNLLKSVMGVNLKKGHARTNWSVRPLPAQLIEYAHADVEYLVPVAQKLMGELDRLGRRDWALELSAKFENPALYQADVQSLAVKLARGGRLERRGFAALLELVRWREERVRQLNVPRRWVADDQVLVDLALVRPKDMEHLSAFRGLNKGELKTSGDAILSALEKASKSQDVVLPPVPKPDIPSASEAQVMDLLKCYVGILADEHKIAVKHLVTSSQILSVMRAEAKKASDFVDQQILTQGAAELVGEDIIAFLGGKRALSIAPPGADGARQFSVRRVEINPLNR